MSRRGIHEKRAPYLFEDVPDCEDDLAGSVVVRVNDRPRWLASIAELVSLCNEASRRKTLRAKSRARVYEKPLSLDYIMDRIDTDDPLRGYMVRRSDTGWLQGFISITTWTTWQRWFKWDASILDTEKLRSQGRAWDADGTLCRDLEDADHDGDPEGEGVIWDRIGEISLLGALRCGSWLVRVVIQELEQAGDYDFLVLQATDM
eukprot:g4252.t1